MPSDDLDTAYRQAMQGHFDPWGPDLQLPTAAHSPPTARMDPFAGSQHPRPYYNTLPHGPVQPSSQLLHDHLRASGADQSLPDIPPLARRRHMQQEPSSRPPTSD